MRNPTREDLVQAAAEERGMNLERAVVAADENPDSSRIYIIEDIPGDGYTLCSYGVDGDGNANGSEPIQIPETAVGPVQGLLHAAGLHITNREFLESEDNEGDVSIRDIAQEFDISKPLDPGELDL